MVEGVGGFVSQCEPGKVEEEEEEDQGGACDIPPLQTCWAGFWVIKILPLLSNAMVSAPSDMLAHVHLPLVYLLSQCLLSPCCRARCCLFESTRLISLKLFCGFLSSCIVSAQVISSLHLYFCVHRFDTIIHP